MNETTPVAAAPSPDPNPNPDPAASAQESTVTAPPGDPSAPSQPDQNPVPVDHALVPQPEERPATGWMARLLARFGLRAGGTLREDLHEALADGSLGGEEFSPEERAMLQNILRLREQRVADIMVPRAQISAVADDVTLDVLLREFQETGHSRLPVYRDTLDDPRGMVLIKDLLLHMTRISEASIDPEVELLPLDLTNVDLAVTLRELDLMRTVLFVPHPWPRPT